MLLTWPLDSFLFLLSSSAALGCNGGSIEGTIAGGKS
jgi:hypothetical protein